MQNTQGYVHQSIGGSIVTVDTGPTRRTYIDENKKAKCQLIWSVIYCHRKYYTYSRDV